RLTHPSDGVLNNAGAKVTKPTDIQVIGASLYLLPVSMRVPLKFGTEVTTEVTCARVALTVRSQTGHEAVGWGETPLSVNWVWPSALPYAERAARLEAFCQRLVDAWVEPHESGDVMQVGYDFQKRRLLRCLADEKRLHPDAPLSYLAALVCCSPFDLALHDAFGHICGRPVYDTYCGDYLNRDLSNYLDPGAGHVSFVNRFPTDYLSSTLSPRLPAWHLVGGLDPIVASELAGTEPDDGYPVLLSDWIRTDGLKCLKIKLRGNDPAWDYERIVQIGRLAIDEHVDWLTVDFNCTVTDPDYVVQILDGLVREEPRIFGMILYVEQPFPYELDEHPIDVHACSARKPLFMDESAHDWKQVRRGRELGWTGVALKTCKTQTGALLSLCWAKAHGMTLMVQDLTNPMLAQIPHCLLAQHAGTIMGVETNAMQFYPEASAYEAQVHPGIYRRRLGCVDLKTIQGPGFGYRLDEIDRPLPAPVATRQVDPPS
ncbi:MAG: hypothetical protein KDA60_16675, partial [Planctomycetales bacterium]|nr:hypothetical protein [Planctomycetales bacterium]